MMTLCTPARKNKSRDYGGNRARSITLNQRVIRETTMRTISTRSKAIVSASFLAAFCACMALANAQKADLHLTDATSGIRLFVEPSNNLASLKVLLRGQPDSDPGIVVLFPEHVTARQVGKTEPEQLYLYRPGQSGTRPQWRRDGQSLSYEMDLGKNRRMIARVTLEEDGLRYRYQFVNHSSDNYAFIQAVTDPRMVTPYFHDMRLQRTYVHHPRRFDLLASETPARINMPLAEWLPNRYRAPYTWPIDAARVSKQPDGVTWYNTSVAVDEPFIATKSTDGEWIMATFSFDPGNVWTNPELTCQHADPQVTLHPGETRTYEVKTLLIRGNLDQVLQKVKQQRPELEH
jgi:hypothetical protein